MAGFEKVGDVKRHMRQAGLLADAMPLLGRVPVKDPHRWPVLGHHPDEQGRRLAWGGVMDNRFLAAERSVVGVDALDARPGLVRGCPTRLQQTRRRRVPDLGKTAKGVPQHVHQPALVEPHPEQVRQGRLRPFIEQRLEGLRVGSHCA